jgi:hypothetical protein
MEVSIAEKINDQVKMALKKRENDFARQEEIEIENRMMIQKLSYHKNVMADTIDYLEKELKASKEEIQKAVSENRELMEKLSRIEEQKTLSAQKNKVVSQRVKNN